MYNNRQYQWKNLTGVNSPAITVFSGSGTLHTVVLNGAGTNGTVILTDLGSPSVTIGTITVANSAMVTLFYDVAISNGLSIKTTNSPDITVTWQK